MLKHGWAFFLFLPALTHAGMKDCVEPIKNRSQMPMSAIFLELEMESACVLGFGETRWDIFTQQSNTTLVAPYLKGLPRLLLDHERSEQTLEIRMGLGHKSDLGLKLRCIDDWEGRLDPLVRNFHEISGLPYASRKTQPDGQFLYWQYNPEYPRPIYLTESQHGRGDSVLSLRILIRGNGLSGHSMNLSSRIVLKLPSGPNLPTISSGAVDQGFGLMLESTTRFWGKPSGWLANLGIVRPGNTSHHVYPQEQYFVSGGMMFSAELNGRWSGSLQTQIASPRYRTSPVKVQGLSTWQAILLIGLTHKIGEQNVFIGITEDLLANASEDFSLIAGWSVLISP